MNKNIYILYPPGYSGSYLSWCISKSDANLADITVDDPLNNSNNASYGGQGTAHLHHRVPTHTGIRELMYWKILHAGAPCQIFVVNVWHQAKLHETIDAIMNFDPDPVFIHITADAPESRELGFLNALIKWPLYFKITGAIPIPNIDLDNIIDNIQLRNACVTYFDRICPVTYSLTTEIPALPLIDDLYTRNHTQSFWSTRERYSYWYNTRCAANPHEVNGDQYIIPYYEPRHYYNIDLLDVYNANLPDRLDSILKQAQLENFDFTFVENYHQTYVNAQPNLAWVDEINTFRKTRKLTEFLVSNSVVQALVIREIKNYLPADYIWEDKDIYEIVENISGYVI